MQSTDWGRGDLAVPWGKLLHTPLSRWGSHSRGLLNNLSLIENSYFREYFPNVIGAVDGCHVEIELTEEKVDELSYRNYHGYYSMILLVKRLLCYYLTVISAYFTSVNPAWSSSTFVSAFFTCILLRISSTIISTSVLLKFSN